MAKLTDVYESTSDWSSQRQVQVEAIHETNSTNDLARTHALSEDSDFKLYLTAHQTKGRGRGSNSWQDTGAGDCLLSSWSFRMAGAPQPIAGPSLGLALYQAAEKIWPTRSWSIKPPNDLYLDGKKIAGILAETISAGSSIRLIVGIGFNVLNHPRAIENSTHFESDVDAEDWFRFLDELLTRLTHASLESQKHQLSVQSQQELLNAINANPSKKFVATHVTATGDILHNGGRIRWSDL